MSRRAARASAEDAIKVRRAKTGLALLILALVVSIGAFAFAGLGLRQKLPPELVSYAVLLSAGYLAGWAVVHWTARGADPVLLPTAAILGGLGVAMLYRIMVDRGEPRIWKEQAVWLGVGLAVFVLVLIAIRDIRQLDAFTYTLGLIGVVLLLLPIVPGVGYEINGARLWAHVGSISVPARGVRQDLHRHLPGVLPIVEARATGERDGSPRDAPRERSRTAAPCMGCIARRALP